MALKSYLGYDDFLIEMVDGIPVVKINIMRATVKEVKSFKQILDSLLAANHRKMIIDFSECSFVDSAMVGVMINAVKEIRKLNGDIVTITPSGSINNIFAQTGLNKIFKQFDKLELALASFGF
jgi:anti-sigma B factor antagonist